MKPGTSHDDRCEIDEVVDTVIKRCRALACKFDIFQRIMDGLKQTETLRADILTGGLTNLSYKVYLETSPDVAVFAKLAFPYALWQNEKSRHFDVQRTRNEFTMMEKFARLAPDCSVTPYFCEAVGDKMLLVTEWCPNDDLLSSQVIRGHVDKRLLAKLARTIAKLHCLEFDPTFNTNVRSTMTSTFDVIMQKFQSLQSASDDSRTTRIVQELGMERCKKLVDKMQFAYVHSRDCLVHSDLHVKNILVERADGSNSHCAFNGSFAICDWEMAFAGPIGRDIGSLLPFIMCSAIAFAITGEKDRAMNLVGSMDVILSEYAQGLREAGKDESFIEQAFQSIIGWCGRFMFLGFYTSGTHVGDFPIDHNNKVDKELLMDAIGVIGLMFMMIGFDEVSGTKNELHDAFKNALFGEMVNALGMKVSKFSALNSLAIVSRYIAPTIPPQ